jgi:3D-(3,5/4)-trihydroxycyclohexane-1,2-dione acylhydrolase (decyclizing)
MQPTELVTAVQEHKKIITIVIDNRGHQCIWPLQVSKGGPGREFGTQYRERSKESGRLDGAILEFDIAANAASMGCAAWSTTTIEEFEAALTEAREVDGPAVIVARVEPWRYLSGSGAFWDVGVPLTSQRPGSQEGTAKHLEGRARQRFYAATTAPGAR